jgi:long-chain acyl-CoA synthetase
MHIRNHLHSDKPAVVLHPSGLSLSYATLEARANQLAHHFRQVGLREGDVVAVMMENNEHILAVMWAARRAGLYYVLANTHLKPAEAAYILNDCAAKAVVASAATAPLALGALALLPGDADPALRIMADADVEGWQRYPDCVAGLPATPIADEREGDLLQYSSGTTGRPKGIRRELLHASPAEAPSQLLPMMSLLGICAGSIYLNPAPLYHTSPAYWSMAAQSLGVTVVIMEKFTPQGALDAIQRYRVTHGQFVPAMFVRMLKLPLAERDSYDVSSLIRVVHAAAPCPPDIKREMIDWWGPIVDEFYSSSEGAGICFIRAHEWLAHPGSVGRPILGTPHVLDDLGQPLPPGTPGTLYFENAMPFEYLNDEAKTARAVNDRGWVTVGDIGYLDDDGYVYLTDRRHHMIISGGVNIYPQEAEDALISHPGVSDAAVFGIPDAEMGQSVKAVVRVLDRANATDDFAAELLAWVRARVAHYKCPRSISFEEDLPRSDTGKLVKQPLIDKYSQRAPGNPAPQPTGG